VADWRAVNRELAAFSPALEKRRQLVALNKMDVDEAAERADEVTRALEAEGMTDVWRISAAGRIGLGPLLAHIAAVLPDLTEDETPAVVPVLRPVEHDPDTFTVQRVVGENAMRVSGARAERAAAMTDFDNDEAVARFQRILDAMGVTDRLRALGASEGMTIRIGECEFDWVD
jgi:GTP-binding protein